MSQGKKEPLLSSASDPFFPTSSKLPAGSIELNFAGAEDLPTRKSLSDIYNHLDGPEPTEIRRDSLSERAERSPTKRKDPNQDFGLGDKEWHLMGDEQLFMELKTRIEGLSSEEHRHRLLQYGPNRITPPKVRHWFVKFLINLIGE